ncbi:hypothetical protein FHS59_004037 [Algoriphagus iocasae]|uniref:Uncharacterized protein n=1 Tax=Algoriphagus iocasae TaxID=1836499 RepID=A0A841MUW5_9BACT|nr:hypothetical protein [Algoriphagus iocasae]
MTSNLLAGMNNLLTPLPMEESYYRSEGLWKKGQIVANVCVKLNILNYS